MQGLRLRRRIRHRGICFIVYSVLLVVTDPGLLRKVRGILVDARDYILLLYCSITLFNKGAGYIIYSGGEKSQSRLY